MDRDYKLSKPEEFQMVIEDLFYQYRDTRKSNLLIALKGDLGAGKTTFTQELGKMLGVTEPITSPTFTIMKQYELVHELFDRLVHIDAYRFESKEEAKPLRLDEVFTTPRAIICVEWPERIPTLIPKDAISIVITITDGEERSVRIHYPE
jgi:tRNA threonylcarbamoyladenosine biosynthesis protein TsaE